MPTINHLQRHLSVYGPERMLFTAASMVLFFVTFDGTLMYLAPIVMTNHGLSEGTMGLIIGMSSVEGLAFDVILGRLLERSSYRMMFFAMLAVAATYPFFLFGATTITVYLIAMAVWGLYYNLYNMGTIDFVESTNSPAKYTSSFGVLKVFDGLGNLIAPFVGSLLIVAALSNEQMMRWPLVLIAIALVFYLLLMMNAKEVTVKQGTIRRRSFGILMETRLWREIGHILLPVFLLTVTINAVDAAIWTIGPIYSESLALGHGQAGGALMVAYTLPPLIVGWFIGRLVVRFGKKNVALAGLLIGSVFAVLVGLIGIPILLIVVMFCTSFSFALAWPSINAAYADYIKLEQDFSKEIEAVEDWFTNLGDTLGPIVGGYAAEFFGNAHAFMAIGAFGAVAALILIFVTPERITARITIA